MPYIPGRKRPNAEEEDDEPKKKPVSEKADDLDLLKLRKSYKELSEAHKQIRESHVEMILNLAIAAEYKDPDTGNHILRISDYATAIAAALSLSKDQIEHLRYASPMHDIGKIGIPDKILQKPGKLTPEEWVLMKQHTLIGARMFQSSKSPLLKAAADIARTHHEKYDGSGYPAGLKGKDIPLFGRITAMADVFDAIVSKRCYKKADSFDQGMAYIESLSGTHMDPDIVRIFLKSEKNIRKIYDANLSIQKYIEEAQNEISDVSNVADMGI